MLTNNKVLNYNGNKLMTYKPWCRLGALYARHYNKTSYYYIPDQPANVIKRHLIIVAPKN